METKKIMNKVNVSADAQFIYEEVLLSPERKLPSWEEALIIVDEAAAIPYMSALRKAKANLRRAEKAESRYRGTDTDIHNILRERLETASMEWDNIEGDERYTDLRRKAFELYDQYDGKFRTLDRRAIESEMENYIDAENGKGQLIYERYFKKVYFDKKLGVSLLLFLYREAAQSNTQYWSLAGIMELKNYAEEDEYCGVYMADHLAPLIDQPYKGDWVLDERAKAREREKLNAEIEKEGFGADYLTEIKGLLKNYKNNKTILAVAGDSARNAGLADKMDYLDKCIKHLSDDDKKFISEYIQLKTLGKLAKRYNYAKTTISYRLNKVLSVIETLFFERYDI